MHQDTVAINALVFRSFQRRGWANVDKLKQTLDVPEMPDDENTTLENLKKLAKKCDKISIIFDGLVCEDDETACEKSGKEDAFLITLTRH